MTTQWETVHIFISSTFNDMHAERDYLVKQVFPQLREWCQKRKLRLVDIDLRWGVTEADATTRNVVKVCLDRIDDCRPFFLCFLGQRRGWVPRGEQISAATFDDFPALKELAGVTSVTEMEIIHALVNPLHRGRVRDPKKSGEFYEASKYAFFYLRDKSFLDQLPAVPPQLRQTYTNDGIKNDKERELQNQKLAEWRDATIPATGRPVRIYRAQWNTKLSTPELLLPLKCPSMDEKAIHDWQEAWGQAGIIVRGVDVEVDPAEAAKALAFNKSLSRGRLSDFQTDDRALSQVILADLQNAITARYPDHVEVVGETELQKELDQQEQFLFTGSEGFIEREGDFDDLDAYVKGDSHQPFFLTAAGGMGKSSLLAKWVNRYQIQMISKPSKPVTQRGEGKSDLHKKRLMAVQKKLGRAYELIHSPWLRFVKGVKEIYLGLKIYFILSAPLKKVDPSKADREKQPVWTGLGTTQDAGSPTPKQYGATRSASPRETGKTNLLIDHIKSSGSRGNETIHYRFIGQSDRSTKVYSLLHLLLEEIKETSGKFEEEIPDDPLRLRKDFTKILKTAGKQGKTIIVLDALNQLETGLSDLDWLPYQLPENVKLIVSFKRGGSEQKAEELLQRLQGQVILSEVKPFNNLEHRRALIKAYLALYLKQLDGNLLDTLIKVKGAENPLYLKVVLSELRVFGVFINLGDKIKSDFGDDPVSAFQGLLNRLECDPAYSPVESRQAVPLLFGLLAHARQGLSVDELTSLLIQSLELKDNESTRMAVADTVHLYLRQVRPFLAQREGRYDFFFESFRNAALERYVSEKPDFPKRPSQAWHRFLAEYYSSLPILQKNGNEKPSLHKLADLPYHQTSGNLWDELRDTLTDFGFLEAKCRFFSIYDLEADYRMALQSWRGKEDARNVIKAFEERLGQESHVLLLHPDLLFPTLYNNLSWLDTPGGPLHTLCEKAKFLHHGWLRMTQDPRPEPPLHLFALEGHTMAVNSVAVTPDSQKIISASEDKTIKIWELKSRRLLYSMIDMYPVNSVAISPDGRYIVSGSDGASVKIWDVSNGRLVRTLDGHSSRITSVVVTPDGQEVISGSWDHSIKVWDLTSGRLLRTLVGHSEGVEIVVVTQDGQYLVSGGKDRTLKVWNLASGQIIHSIGKSVTTLVITPDGQNIFSAGYDKNIDIWDLASGQLLRSVEDWGDVESLALTPSGDGIISGVEYGLHIWGWPIVLEGHRDRVQAIAATPDGYKIVSGSRDCTIKVWSYGSSGGFECSLEGHTKKVNAITITQDGKKAVSGSDDQSLKVWDLESGQLLQSMEGCHEALFAELRKPVTGPYDLYETRSRSDVYPFDVRTDEEKIEAQNKKGHTSQVVSVEVTPDGQKVISGSTDKIIKIWDLVSGTPLHTLTGTTAPAYVVTPDGKRLISAGEYGELDVWELETGHLLNRLDRYSRRTANSVTMEPVVTSVMLLPGDGDVFAWSKDKKCDIWRLSDGKLLDSWLWEPSLVTAMTPDGKTVIACYHEDRNISVFDLVSKKLLRKLEGHTGYVNTLAVTQDGLCVVSGADDGKIKYWNLANGQLLRTLEGDQRPVTAVAITPDGKRVVAGMSGGKIKVWDLFHERRLRSLEGHPYDVTAVAITPDGQQIVSASRDQMLKVWDLTSGRLVNSLDVGLVDGVAITIDGRQVIARSKDSTRVWDLASGQSNPSSDAAVAEALTVLPSGQKLVAIDKNLTLQDSINGNSQTIFVNDTNILSMGMSPNARWFFCGDASGRVWIFEWIQ